VRAEKARVEGKVPKFWTRRADMPRDTILFDINETVLDLSSLKPRFKAAFGNEAVTARQLFAH